MESKKINQLATELAPELSDLTIIGDPTTGISKKITLSQMASLFTGTVEEYASLSAFPLVGTADTIYIALDTNILYRWNTGTSAYVELSPNVVSSLVFNDANGFDGTISLVGSVATLTITTALTQGSVPFIGASGALTQDNTNFFWDNSNKRLGINTNTPTGALDVFGSGIIGRLNGTSTNNAFLGFASAGSNKWSIGNVQSDHRFRIYSEANTSELVSVLQTGEFGIGIANPTTKLHIDGGASALIANLDANVSVAKSISFRSDNSNRINLEVSGTESGSNTGGNFFIRRYSDAGALIDTPLTITRSTGNILATTTDFTILGTTPALRLTDNAATGNNGNVYLRAEKSGVGYNTLNYIGYEHIFKGGGSETTYLTINSAGAATFSSTVTIGSTSGLRLSSGSSYGEIIGTSGKGLTFYTNDGLANPMTISSIGNVGIGNVPSAWDSIFRAIQIGNYGSFIAGRSDSQEQLFLGTNAFYGASGWVRQNATFAARYYMSGGAHNFETAASSSAGSAIGWDLRMVISNSGYVGVNTSSPRGILNTKNGTGELVFSQINGRDIEAIANGSRGNLDILANNLYISYLGTGTVYSNGGVLTNTNPSDKNLKENITDLSFGLNEILQLRPVSYDWKNNPTNQSTQYGFIAQEVKEILPQLVTEFDSFEDEEREISIKRLGLDKEAIFVSLVKAIQELKAEIDILKSK